MKDSIKAFLCFLFGGIILLSNVYQVFTQPNGGFKLSFSTESIGFNLGKLAILAIGIVLFVESFRINKKSN